MSFTVADRKILKKARDEAWETEHHLHGRECWFGISADQSGNDWALSTLNPYQAISGADTYGADANDEAKVLGTDDTPCLDASNIMFDMHRIEIVDVSQDTIYKLRVVWGTGTMADAITANQYTEVMVSSDVTNPQQASGTPVDVMIPRLDCGVDKVWIQAWNATNNATIDFFVGIHEYTR